MSSFSAAAGPPRKTRVALACKRCKRRKQRCDGAHPVCKSCDRAGTPCIYERTVRPQYPGGKTLYINALEERIAFLEARLPAYAEDHFGGAPSSSVPSSNGNFRPRLDSSSSHRDSASEDVDHDDRNSIIDGVAYLSLCASGTTGNAPEPYYLGSSSGAAIARMIQSSIFRNPGRRAIAHGIRSAHARQPDPVGTHAASSSISTHSTLAQDSSFEFPHREQARRLFDVFFDRMHTRWPFLDRKAYSALFEAQYTNQGSMPITERSIMHLIYAIAARFLQLTQKNSGVDSEKHLLAAIEPMDYILEQHNLATVQFLLLLAVHGQRSPYGAGAWSQVRYAVSLCIELGLHRERKAHAGQNARDVEIRRRAFWSCYCLDRGTSVILGRAFAIGDRDINVSLPNPSLEFWDLTHAEPPHTHTKPWCNVEPFIHIINLERILSRIHRTMFRVDKDVFAGSPESKARLVDKMTEMRSDLETWIQTVPQLPKGFNKITWLYDPESASHDSQDYFNLQYHKSILMLFTVLLPSLPPTDPRFITAARSAACVCIAYKRLNQTKTLTYTMISLHSCFVAGLTLVYCLWRDRTLFSYDVFEATQACSQSLTIFGEKWSGAVKYRDIFDALSASLFKTLVNPIGLDSGAGLGLGGNGAGRPLKAKFDKGPSPTASASPEGLVGDAPAVEPSMSELVSDAVKEAFMEVDEEAPGGWQGWRMWNEMLGDNSNAPEMPRYSDTPSWPDMDSCDFKDAGMMQTPQYNPMGTNDWHFGNM
ncbi:fungal-specific transcription factor domain-containing protein [Stachybotrys elegans]|uniref:Fungal-specific transcription factor domain-containing protein n=1 Tax=Stachybotrys elegans TaxID=80388 RepID=A0A8K0SR34_9HYPO|nr:fungal-specific transcription factor domain-containing protein [Stachybotrys elegans]